ncbi:MAG: ribosome small subunit-dependent GTPase A [Planctomycetota bacterium]|nr:ribosome small subunit-dependent GTPase A [Planctomycetota bacterium]
MIETGIVLRHEGGVVIVDLGGDEVRAVVRKALKRAAGRRKAVVVGDRVDVERGGEAEGAVVVGVHARRTELSRPDPGNPRKEHILVANVDEVLVVAAARRPEFSAGIVDRFLAAAQLRGMDAALVINKIDLDPTGAYRTAAQRYRELGYTVLEVSAQTGDGIEDVRALLKDHVTTLLGHSGVGKSSIANRLDPALSLRTGEVHESSGQGMHTTTTIALLRLPWGGYLVDTPGIRAFGLWDVGERDLGSGFREIAARANDCRFNDCLHEKEPSCAVKAAVESGAIDPVRYESYLRILQTLREDAVGY